MTELDNLSLNNVSVIEDREKTGRLAFKRNGIFNSDSEVAGKSEDVKRRKEDCVAENEEIELRDRLLDDLSSSQSSQDSEDIHKGVQNRVCNDADQQTRKIVKLEGPLPNLALPDGWMAINHRSGGIVYLHRTTRVCTWSRPYYLGRGSVRKHDVPIAAIPCLHQTKALSNKSLQINQHSSKSSSPNGDCKPIQVQSVLNFLNTAGSIEDHLKPNCTMADSMLSKQTCDSLEVEAMNCDDGSHSDNNIGVSGGLQKECETSNEGQESNCGSSLVKEKGQGGTIEVTQDKCCFQELPFVFNPEDGLDVVNNTLGVDCCMKHDNEEQRCNKLSSRSTQDLAPKCSPNVAVKTTINEVKDNIEMESNDASARNLYDPNTKLTENEDSSELPKRKSVNGIKNAGKNSLKTTHTNSGIALIDAEELSSYLNKLFEFEELTFDQERNVVKPADKQVEEGDSVLSSVLDCLPYCVKGKMAKENKEWVLNPGGKTPVAILHEYCQGVLKEKPVYVQSECDSTSTPFMAEVQINGITHGSGVASTKKQAKQIAAEIALEALLPDKFHKIRDYVISREELECFDQLKINNSNIYELSIKSGLPTPSQVLQECLKRNQGVCSSTIHFKMIPQQNQEHTFIISCGKHTAEGPCKNKKIGKQLAAQALLMKLHPHISTWGSLLRIYCDRPSSIVKKYKTADTESLSICTPSDVPRGLALLDRLKKEMYKIANNAKNEQKYTGSYDTSSISTVDI